MKKLLIILCSLFFISLSLAMKCPVGEGIRELLELSKQEAETIYWDTVFTHLPYEEYRANLMKTIPLIDFIRPHYKRRVLGYGYPLLIAVWMRDTELVRLLLEHGADPLFRDFSDLNAYDLLDYKSAGVDAPENPYPGTSEEIIALLDSYSKRKKSSI